MSVAETEKAIDWAARVGVVHEGDISAGRSLMQRHPQRVEHEVGAHVRRELPADDRPAIGVDHEWPKASLRLADGGGLHRLA
jgi:hypothetical protein